MRVSDTPDEPPKAIAAVRSLLRTFPMEGYPDSPQNAEMNDFLDTWDRWDRYMLLSLAGVLVRWIAIEREMTEDEVLDALVEENWPRY